MVGGELVAEEGLEFPYPLCIQNTESMGAIKADVREIKESLYDQKEYMENHLNELVNNNGLTGNQKVVIYSGIITLIITVMELLFG